MWLNFAADHMDRYKIPLEDYRKAKERIFENMGEEQVIVAQVLVKILETIKSQGGALHERMGSGRREL